MANVLIWMSHEAGHVLPTVKVARDLQSIGHTVWYLTCGNIIHELATLKFKTLPFLPEHADVLATRSVFNPCEPAACAYKRLSEKFQSVGDYINAVKAAIRAAAIAVDAAMVLVDGVFDASWTLDTFRELSDLCVSARLYIHLPYQRFTAEELAGQCGPLIFLSPAEFEIPQMRINDAHYTEASIFRGPHPSVPAPGDSIAANGKPLVYCSLGTQAALYGEAPAWRKVILETARAMPEYHFALNVGAHEWSEDLGDLPSNVQTLRFVAQSEVIASSAATITNGGFGTVKEAIYFGIPTIVCPQKWDQSWNALRVRYHGLGLECSGEKLSVDYMRRALRGLVEQKVTASRARSMKDCFQLAEQQKRSAQVCAEIMSLGPPV